jgi:hypothetical protein
MNRLRIAVVVVDNDAVELDRRPLHFNLDGPKCASRLGNYDIVVIYRPVHISFTQVSPVLCMGHSITTEQ